MTQIRIRKTERKRKEGRKRKALILKFSIAKSACSMSEPIFVIFLRFFRFVCVRDGKYLVSNLCWWENWANFSLGRKKLSKSSLSFPIHRNCPRIFTLCWCWWSNFLTKAFIVTFWQNEKNQQIKGRRSWFWERIECCVSWCSTGFLFFSLAISQLRCRESS